MPWVLPSPGSVHRTYPRRGSTHGVIISSGRCYHRMGPITACTAFDGVDIFAGWALSSRGVRSRSGRFHGVHRFTARSLSSRGSPRPTSYFVARILSSQRSFQCKGFEDCPPRLMRRYTSHPTNYSLLQQRRENVTPQLQRPKHDAHFNQTAGLAYMERCFTATRASRGTTTHVVLPWRGRRGGRGKPCSTLSGSHTKT